MSTFVLSQVYVHKIIWESLFYHIRITPPLIPNGIKDLCWLNIEKFPVVHFFNCTRMLI